MFRAPDSTEVLFESGPLGASNGAVVNATEGGEDVVASPRTSRHIDFVDDGKLFEGHFTLHARSLKTLIQLLVDHQAEQHVIITDLQDQVNTLRLQATKMRRVVAPPIAPAAQYRPGSEESAHPSRLSIREVDDLRQRVKQLEAFRALWGVQTEEVENLFNAYGEPLVTPEEYTAFLLSLQPFRLLRQDTRNSIALAGGARTSISYSESGRNQGKRDSIDYRLQTDENSRGDSRGRRGRRSSKQRDSREGRGSWSGSKQTRSDKEPARSGRDDDSDDRYEARRGQEKGVSERDGSRKRRDESRRSRDQSLSNQDEIDEISKARDGYRADRRGSRDDFDEPRRPRDESRGKRDEPRSARDEPRSARDESRGKRDEPRSARDESRGKRDEPRSAREESRGKRDEPRSAREESRGKRDEPRSANDESRGAHRGPRPARGEPSASLEQDMDDLMDRMEALERRLARGLATAQQSRDKPTSRSTGPPASTSAFVDEDARASVEELDQRVNRRFKEIERAMGRSKGGAGSGDAPAQRAGRGQEKRPPQQGEVVDHVAREDAAASLEQVEELEKLMHKKLREMAKGMGKASTSSGNVVEREKVATEPRRTNAPVTTAEPKSAAAVVDQVARNNAVRSLDAIQDLEEDWGKRWQSLEERLRIIGRATVNGGSLPTASAASIDRKAREDASMSLMRIQQVERELSMVRRLLHRQKAPETGTEFPSAGHADHFARGEISVLPTAANHGISPSTVTTGASKQALSNAQGTQPSSDVDYQLRMQALENEVEQRMGDVNRALAALSAPGYAVIGSRKEDDSAALFASSLMMSPSVLVVSSNKGGADITEKAATAQAHDDEVVLRSPQQGVIGAPLVKREAPADSTVQRTPAATGETLPAPLPLPLPPATTPAAPKNAANIQGSPARLDTSGKASGELSGGLSAFGSGEDKYAGIKALGMPAPAFGTGSRGGALDRLQSHGTRLGDVGVTRSGDHKHKGYTAEPVVTTEQHCRENMPAVDVDVASIPDMIEAQLTLSYSRLAQLVRLIVDQGNGHDLDIDKLASRMDVLARENADLRNLVLSLLEERKTSSDDMRGALETLRSDIARVSNACEENAERMSAFVAQSEKRNANIDERLQAQMERTDASLQESSATSAALADNARTLEQALRATEDFVALWGSDASRASSLSRQNGSEVADSASAEQCTEYLHSLPAFVRVFEELEVVRQMLRQQATDALAVKTVAGSIRRASCAEAATAASAANGIDRSAVESLQASLEDINRRLRVVETKRLLSLEHAVRSQQPSSPSAQLPEENGTDEALVLKQLEQQAHLWARREDMSLLAGQIKKLEERLHGLLFKAEGGESLEQAVLSDMDGRIRLLEDTVEGSSQEILQKQEQDPKESDQQEGSAQEGKQEAREPPIATTHSSGNVLSESAARQLSKNNMTRDGSASHHERLSIEQPNVAHYCSQSSVPGAVQDPGNHVQFVLKQEDGLCRRVAQLEENCAILEMHKIGFLQLQRLEQVMLQSLSTANLRGASQQQRQQESHVNGVGQASGGPHPYPMFGQHSHGIPYMPQRPASALNGRTVSDGRTGYATDNASSGMSGTFPAGGAGSAGRPMFIGGNSQFLRDALGTMTYATIAPSHPR